VSVAQRDASLRERVDRGVAVDGDDVQIGPPGGECDRERAGAGADAGDDARGRQVAQYGVSEARSPPRLAHSS